MDYSDLIGDALTVVNKKRADRGLYPFIRDAALDILCEEITYTRGIKLHNGHLRNSMYSKLARAEGVGWNSSIDRDGSEFYTCFLYTRQYRTAAAKYCIDDSGRTFYTLILK